MKLQKLLIFGDSFGEENLRAFPQGHHLEFEYKKLISYHQILRNQKSLFREVETHAVGGSDLWSQYEIFQKKYKGKEKVLWFITHPGRLSINNKHFPNLDSSKHLLKKLKDEQNNPCIDYDYEYSLIDAGIKYHQYLVRPEFDNFVQHHIIKKIRFLTRNQVVFVPCFFNSLTQTAINSKKVCLADIFSLENHAFEIIDYYTTISKYDDIRRNHLCEENHIVLAEQLIKIFNGDIKEINFNSFKTPNKDDFSKYFIPVKKHES